MRLFFLVQLTGALLQLGVKHPFLIQLKGQVCLTRILGFYDAEVFKGADLINE
jgi:hypothetical protein